MVTRTLNAVLTERERDMLSLVGQGLTNQDIGNELGISTRTVKSNLHRVCIKLGAKNRVQAVRMALSRRAIGAQEIMPLEELIDLLRVLGPEAMDIVIQSLKSKSMSQGKYLQVLNAPQEACDFKKRKY